MQQKIMTYIDHAMILLMLCFLKDFFLTNTVYTPKLLLMNVVCALCLAFFVPTFYSKLFDS